MNVANAIVSEPVIVQSDDKLYKFSRYAIKHGAISIADPRIKNHPLYEQVKTEHEICVHKLSDDNERPTTKESLEAEEQAKQAQADDKSQESQSS